MLLYGAGSFARSTSGTRAGYLRVCVGCAIVLLFPLLATLNVSAACFSDRVCYVGDGDAAPLVLQHAGVNAAGKPGGQKS